MAERKQGGIEEEDGDVWASGREEALVDQQNGLPTGRGRFGWWRCSKGGTETAAVVMMAEEEAQAH